MEAFNNGFMKNGIMLDFDPQAVPAGSGLVYEVIRIIDGIPLFFDEHYARLVNSAASSGSRPVSSYESFRQMTDDFLAHRPKLNGDYNIKIVFQPQSGDLYIQTNPVSYPPPALYERGIHTELLHYMRPDPNSKIINLELGELAAQKKTASGAYEVLLVDQGGSITEGSKSNLFFVKNDELLTPPLVSVLPGVTRQKIIDTAKNININVIETNIKSDDLHTYEGAFMSGTSPKILPISSIGTIPFDSSHLPLITALMKQFNETIATDLKNYRNSAQSRL